MTRGYLALPLVAACFSQPTPPGGPGAQPYAEPKHYLFVGGKHACTLNSGVAFCWGDNTYGQLGVPKAQTPYSGSAVAADGTADGWTDFAVGTNHSCGIINAHVVCFGANDHGQSQGTQPINDFALPKTPARVFAGAAGSCAIDTDGGLWCWGHLDNQTGDLGSPTQIVPLGVDGPWASIAIAFDHACARRADFGDVLCWGDDDQDQLAEADNVARTPSSAAGPEGTYVVTAAANGASCAIDQHGSLGCWGTGAATTVGTTAFQLVDASSTGRTWTSLAMSQNHVCGVANGEVHCYGDADTGALGRGVFAPGPDAPGPQVLASVVEVGVGEGFSCAYSADQSVRCWGSNMFGELGNGHVATTRTPFHLDLGGQVQQLALGYGHTCALLVNGDVRCWGDNELLQADPAGASLVLAPSAPIVQSVDRIAAGAHHTCAHTSGGNAIRCWGTQGNPVPQLTFPAMSLAAGDNATCAAGMNGTSQLAYCWGTVPGGDPVTMPHSVTAAQAPVAVAVGGGFAAVMDDMGGTKSTYVWGNNCALGSAAVAPGSAIANTTIATPDVVLAQGGEGHGCYEIAATHDLECWGANDYSQVTPQGSACEVTPVPVGPGINWRSIPALAVAGDHSCALDESGTAYCWGDNRDFSMGSDVPADIVQQPSPVASGVVGGGGIDKIATGPHHTCVITGSSDATVWCWGLNQFGEVGNGESFVASPPADAIVLAP